VEGNQLNIFVAFLAGFLSFASPCVLPLVPVYLGYMTGATVQRGGQVQAARWRVLLHSLAFVAGFSVVFVLLGASAGLVRDLIFDYRQQVQIVAGVLLVVFGLNMLGVLRIGFLNYEKRKEFNPSRRLGYLRSLIIGLGFALGWTPCVGWALGLMYGLAQQDRTVEAVPLFVAYSLGLGVPFVLTALLGGQLAVWLKRVMMRSFDIRLAGRTLLRDLNPISLVSGALLLFMGVLLAFDRVTWLNQFLPQWQLSL
jgi:cytochrome c-type biogenesis protein